MAGLERTGGKTAVALDAATVERLRRRLYGLYGERAGDCLRQILELVDRAGLAAWRRAWDQRDLALICYGDQIREPGRRPLEALDRFLADHCLEELIGIVHLLPFFPYSSDDGFSVIDYRSVDPELGTWDDVEALGRRFDLMFDLVLNHVSQHSRWFRRYLAGEEPFTRYFIEADPQADLSAVVRPRSLPLLTPFDTARGRRHVWTTFSTDQVDLNYAEPQVLVEMIGVLLFYLERGARILRLDAIAYLWKEIGTPSINDPRTHAVVEIFRDLVDALAPGTLILTETNLPHAENLSYFGAGDEAHLVYQFSLPPLLLDAALTGDARPLTRWLEGLGPPPAGTTYLNFTASHDGIGVRPLEGLVGEDRQRRLVAAVEARGGLVSSRRRADGRDVPYELNATWFDALGGGGGSPAAELQVRRFLATQAVMLALRGIPAIYFHSLVGTPNDRAGVEATGRARSINRRRFERAELETILGDRGSPQSQVFRSYRHMLEVRRRHPAFHPEAGQEVRPVTPGSVLAFSRTAAGGERILVAVNLSAQPQPIDLPWAARDLLSGAAVEEGALTLQPYRAVWLDPRAAGG